MALLGNENTSQELRQRAVGHVFDQMFKDKQLDATVGESQADRASREGIAAGNQWVEMQKLAEKQMLTPKDIAEINYKMKLGEYTDAQRMQIEKNLRNRITIPFGDEEVEATPSEAISWYGKQLEQQGKVEKHEQELVQNNLKMYADQIRSRLITYGGNEGESIQAMFNKNGSGYLRMQKIANMAPGEANQAGISPQEILKAKNDKYFVDTQIMHTKYPTGKIPTISIPEEERKKFPPGRPMIFADREGATLFLMPEGDSARILNIVPPGLSPDEWRTEVGKLADLYRME